MKLNKIFMTVDDIKQYFLCFCHCQFEIFLPQFLDSFQFQFRDTKKVNIVVTQYELDLEKNPSPLQGR